MSILRSSCIVVILFLYSFALHAQREPMPGREQQSSPVFLETINLLSLEDGKSRLDVIFRIPYDYFVFVKNPAENSDYPFHAKAEISLELLDNNKISAARELRSKEIGLRKPPSNPSLPKQFLEGAFSFNLVPGNYSVIFEMRDTESDRKYVDNTKTVVLRDFHADTLKISDVIFLTEESTENSVSLVPMNFGGDIPFGENFNSYVEVAARSPLSVTYNVNRIQPENRERKLIFSDTLNPAMIMNAVSLTFNNEDSMLTYHVADSPQKEKHSVVLPVRADTLEQGRYELEVSVHEGDKDWKQAKEFNIRWIGMPLTLRSMTSAIDALEYIATTDELKKMRTSNPKDQREAFNDFWKKRDNTPGTAFNEVMAEYYKRVDYAFVNFNTVKIQNGVKTERGKAYILYGPPTSIDREFSPSSSPKEIWTYINLSKRLTFVDEQRTGEYKLILMEHL